jgi:MFS family permease
MTMTDPAPCGGAGTVWIDGFPSVIGRPVYRSEAAVLLFRGISQANVLRENLPMGASSLGPRFWRFWAASAVSQLGDGIRVTALPLLAAAVTTRPLPVAAVSAAVWLPWLLFGLIGGAVVDRVDRRRLMEAGQFVRLLVMGGLATAVFAGFTPIWLLVLVAFLVGIGEVFVDSALQAVVPAVVEESSLDLANGRLLAAESLANELVGPPLGGLLFTLSHAIPFVCDAASFGASGVLLATLGGDFKAAHAERPPSTPWQDVKEGASYLFHHPVLRSLALAIGAINFGVMAFGAVLVLFAREILHIGAVGFGLLVSGAALGALLGSFGASRIAARIGRARAIVWGLALIGLFSAMVGLTSSTFVAGSLEFLVGFSGAMVNVSGLTLRQTLTPNRLLGRVVSSFRVVGYGLIPLGAAAGGWIASAWGLRATFFFGGGVSFVAAVLLSFSLTERSVEAARARLAPTEPTRAEPPAGDQSATPVPPSPSDI